MRLTRSVQIDFETLKTQNIGVVGLGVTGLAVRDFFQNLCVKSLTLVNSQNPLIEIKENENLLIYDDLDHEKLLSKLLSLDLLVISPGIDPRKGLVKSLNDQGAKLMGEIELSFKYFQFRNKSNATQIAAVSGSNGKTTVVSLIQEVLKFQDQSFFVGGNIGVPWIKMFQYFNKELPKYVVLELSSFQIDQLVDTKFDCAYLTNIYPTHAERYDQFQDYKESKLRLGNFIKTGGKLFCHRENAQDFQSTVINPSVIKGPDLQLKVHLPGKHNQNNALGAYEICQYLGLKDEIIRLGIQSFNGVPHRLEKVLNYTNLPFEEIYNDSKSTNLTSTIAAIKAFDQSYHNLCLIFGGKLRDFKKQLAVDFSLPDNVKSVVLVGESRQLLVQELLHFSGIITECESYESLFEILSRIENCNVLLFSPGYPSFDYFKNFEHRGEWFKKRIHGD